MLHTFWVGNLRLVLDVQVSSGKQHTSVHAKAALGRLLDELGDKRPAMVRGDSGYGNEGILLELEGRNQPYLLRLRQTANVQRLVARQFERQDWSRAETGLPNGGRYCGRLEQKAPGGDRAPAHPRWDCARAARDGKQLRLDLAGPSVHEGERLWEYAVMVTDVADPIEAIGQHPDCENG